jgi:hypothetical protein
MVRRPQPTLPTYFPLSPASRRALDCAVFGGTDGDLKELIGGSGKGAGGLTPSKPLLTPTTVVLLTQALE